MIKVPSTVFQSQNIVGGVEIVHGCKNIALESYHGMYVFADEDDRARADGITIDRRATFSVELGTGNEIGLKNLANGNYLVAELNQDINVNRTGRGGWETFTLESQPRCTVSIKTFHEDYLGAEVDGRLRANRSAVGRSEQFTPKCVGKYQSMVQ